MDDIKDGRGAVITRPSLTLESFFRREKEMIRFPAFYCIGVGIIRK